MGHRWDRSASGASDRDEAAALRRGSARHRQGQAPWSCDLESISRGVNMRKSVACPFVATPSRRCSTPTARSHSTQSGEAQADVTGIPGIAPRPGPRRPRMAGRIEAVQQLALAGPGNREVGELHMAVAADRCGTWRSPRRSAGLRGSRPRAARRGAPRSPPSPPLEPPLLGAAERIERGAAQREKRNLASTGESVAASSGRRCACAARRRHRSRRGSAAPDGSASFRSRPRTARSACGQSCRRCRGGRLRTRPCRP